MLLCRSAAHCKKKKLSETARLCASYVSSSLRHFADCLQCQGCMLGLLGNPRLVKPIHIAVGNGLTIK